MTNSEFGIRNSECRPPTLNRFRICEFRISDFHPPNPSRCWMLDAGSTHPPRRTKRNVGASFRVRQRVVPRIVAVEETQRGWWRALNPPTAAICGPRFVVGRIDGPLAGGGASPWPEATRKDPPTRVLRSPNQCRRDACTMGLRPEGYARTGKCFCACHGEA
jgi:hypothetical protein